MAKDRKRPQPLAEQTKDLRGVDSRKATRTFNWVCQWLAYGLGEWALLDVLEYAAKLGILVAAVAYIYPGCNERKQAAEDSRKTKHYIAWQTLNSAQGKSGNCGRADALMDLNQDDVLLRSIDISHANFGDDLILTNALLEWSKLNNSTIVRSDFSGAQLGWVDLADSQCYEVNFNNCDFFDAIFTNSTFLGCDFANARLSSVNASNTTFRFCNFVHCSITLWPNTEFIGCNFARCDIQPVWYTNDIHLRACNFGLTTNVFGALDDLIRNNASIVSEPITNHIEWLDRLDEIQKQIYKRTGRINLSADEWDSLHITDQNLTSQANSKP